MSNAARHGVGALVGLVAVPVIRLVMIFGTQQMNALGPSFDSDAAGRWLGAAAFVVAAVLFGTLVGSRISPLASLIPGVAYVAYGLAWLAAPRLTAESTLLLLPEAFDRGYLVVGTHETILGVLGAVLLVASLFPSRWRAVSPVSPVSPTSVASPTFPVSPTSPGSPASPASRSPNAGYPGRNAGGS